jgi:hypothetical protein
MKKALIAPNETRPISATETGYRVAQISDAEFDVASPLFWIDVADDTATQKVYNPNTQELVDRWIPPLPVIEEVVEEPTE